MLLRRLHSQCSGLRVVNRVRITRYVKSVSFRPHPAPQPYFHHVPACGWIATTISQDLAISNLIHDPRLQKETKTSSGSLDQAAFDHRNVQMKAHVRGGDARARTLCRWLSSNLLSIEFPEITSPESRPCELSPRGYLDSSQLGPASQTQCIAQSPLPAQVDHDSKPGRTTCIPPRLSRLTNHLWTRPNFPIGIFQ